MVLSAPWADYPAIVNFLPVKKYAGINPMVLSVPWAYYLDIIAFQTAKIN